MGTTCSPSLIMLSNYAYCHTRWPIACHEGSAECAMCDSLRHVGLHLWEKSASVWKHACTGPHRTVTGAEQASALEGNPQEHQRLIASRAGCQALPDFAIITRLLSGDTALVAICCKTDSEDNMHVSILWSTRGTCLHRSARIQKRHICNATGGLCLAL